MGAVLDIAVRPDGLGSRVVAPVEQGVEGGEHQGLVLVGCGHGGLLAGVQSFEPPSTRRVSPVTQGAASEARKTMAPEMSSGWATRFSACMASVASRPSSVLAKLDISVATTPGAT